MFLSSLPLVNNKKIKENKLSPSFSTLTGGADDLKMGRIVQY